MIVPNEVFAWDLAGSALAEAVKRYVDALTGPEVKP